MADIISKLPAEILQMIIENVEWHPYLLHELPLLCPSPSSLKHIKHLHFQADFDSPTCSRCPHNGLDNENGFDNTRESDGSSNESDGSSNESDGSSNESDGSSSESDDYEWGFGRHHHPRDFDHLTFATEMIINRFYDNQLETFSWDLGTCIPEGILGPEGIVNKRQKSLRAISITTDRRCWRRLASPKSRQGSIIDLDGFRKLTSLRWRTPKESDLRTLSSTVKNNRRHLQKLELEFADWTFRVGPIALLQQLPTNDCPFLREFLHISPDPSLPVFPQLRELSLSNTVIGPELAKALNFEILMSLRLRQCHGWNRFIGKVIELKITPRIRTFEIYERTIRNLKPDHYREKQQTIKDFLGSFSGLTRLYLRLADPWLPEAGFWAKVGGHRNTLRRCILDQLWATGSEHRGVLQRGFHQIEKFPSSNPLNMLNTECLGFINQPTYLRTMLLPFTSKTCLKVIHIRAGYAERSLLWKMVEEPETQQAEKTPNGCAANLKTLLSNVTHHGFTWGDIRRIREKFQLQEKFCNFIEWAFSPEGIPSLRTIAVGDFSIGCQFLESRFCIHRNEDTTFSVLEERDKRLVYVLENYWDFVQSCPTSCLM
ncbi:hypothetical protein EDB81DRAFT_921447 [Dactylonectria macrodidyma]|uniref:Uncharacterized protein n=1 Tax=Dactylonectria macrodidyma TaxID=307937 RepID=A0A9P9IBF2_9HYPO|nr:hypothetical protein EDB81DRAFT_921447 [Dactylonectria macrodidyma]